MSRLRPALAFARPALAVLALYAMLLGHFVGGFAMPASGAAAGILCHPGDAPPPPDDPGCCTAAYAAAAGFAFAPDADEAPVLRVATAIRWHGRPRIAAAARDRDDPRVRGPPFA